MRASVGLWAALQRGAVGARAAFATPADALREVGAAHQARISAIEREAWARWVRGAGPEEPSPAQERGSGQLCDGQVAPAPQGAEGPSARAEEGHAGPSGAAGSAGAAEPPERAPLRPYQQEALEAVRSSAPANCSVVLPCGAGKTKLGSAVACDFLELHPAGCVVVLCLRREGMRQWSRELADCWGTEAVEASGACSAEALRGARVILVSYHRMLSERRRAAAAAPAAGAAEGAVAGGAGAPCPQAAPGAIAARLLAAPCGLLLADECLLRRMVPAPRIGELLRTLSGPGRRLVGLTATLLREGMGDGGAEGEGAEWPVLGSCVYRQTFANLAPEYLAPVRCVDVQVPPAGPWRRLFKEQPLAAAVCLSRGKWEVLEHLLALHAEDSVLIVVERCEQARLVASTFGIMPVDGSLPAAQMKDILERFRARKILTLVATHVLDDPGLDFPELSVMVQMGGHFASRRQEQQRLGRLLRWGPVKRRRWEESGVKPTFYVLVHKGTVEERMSRHRTRSVAGVDYEQVPASAVCCPPLSVLRGGCLFGAQPRRGRDELELEGALAAGAAAAAAEARSMEKACFELSTRVAGTLPGGGPRDRPRALLLSDVRAWLRGGELRLRAPAAAAAGSSASELSAGEGSEVSGGGTSGEARARISPPRRRG
ncbi:unnamed protein product [Prorocentrum cordatum]|uniref:DNA 3'-5' helicase n=1 Tax=Prorocentrum cordatum TaxID=2364126 RepID=A0ABN9T4J5_9DINO|nr:unnamed protein product [Polarella glacialis]